MLDFLFGLLSHDLAIDLGTANTLVAIRNKGIVIREPSVVATHKKTKQIVAIGTEAKKMMGKTPAAIMAIRPLKEGVIADFDATVAMLKYYIKVVHEGHKNGGFPLLPKIPRPKVVVGIPSGVTEVEKRAVQDAALSAGARSAFLIEEPMAAAIGSGMTIDSSSGVFVVDIGGGTTEIAVISLGGIVINRSVRAAGDKMDEVIANFLRLKYGLLVGEKTAEEIKIQIGSAWVETKFKDREHKNIEKFTVIRGRDIETGLPRSIKVGSTEIREALSQVINQIVTNIAEIIEETPPELLADILEKGIVLAGGGSLLSGIDKFFAESIKLPVWRADDPQTCVVRGCLKVLEDEKLLARVKVTGGLK